MLKRFLFMALMLVGLAGFSQLDTEHFVPPVYPSTHGWLYPREQVVYISTPTKDPFTYSIQDGAGNVLKTGTVSNANPISYTMSAFASDFVVKDEDLNKVLTDRGIHVVADDKVYCNIRANAGGGTRPNATSMTAKGRAALGTAFRIGHFPSPQNFNDGQNSLATKSSTVGIYATEDNTTIQIDLTGRKPKLRGAGAPSTANVINVTLNKGETYVFAIKSTDSNSNRNTGMIGGLITSDKKIAVNSGSWGGNLVNANVTDIGIDQIVGADKIGTEYAVVRGALSRNTPGHEMVMIVAHEPNTEVKVNGNVVATIANAGGFYKIPASKYSAQGAMYIETSVPAYAYQFMMGSNDYNYKTQGMNFLPPISCKTTSFVDNIPFIEKIGAKTYGGAISIVTTKGATLTVTENGVNKGIGTPKAVPASNYEMYKITGLKGNVAVYSNTIALVSIVGQNAAAGYGGFFSGFVDSKLSQDVNCLPGYLFESSGQLGTFRWFKDGIEIPNETNDSLFATETGDYTFERTLAGCKDTSVTMPAVAVNEFELKGDTTFCAGDSVEWSIEGSGFDSIAWEGGENVRNMFIKTTTETDIRIYSDVVKECYIDTVVPSIEIPKPTVELDDEILCLGNAVTLDAKNVGNDVKWSTGETSQTISVDQTGEYKVVVTNPQGCLDSASMKLTANSCNTDALVTKTDGTDKYYAGATTIYTIVTKNLGPADVTKGQVSDPLPNGISTGDVTWTSIAYGGASTSVSGIMNGALTDEVDIPAGDSVVYTVNISVPLNYAGDLENTVTITATNDTFPDNNTATDVDTKDCNFEAVGSINSRNAGWVKFGNVITGVPYNVIAAGGSRTFEATDGPEKGENVTSLVYNTGTGNSVSLTRTRYNSNNTYKDQLSGLYDKTPHAWTGLSGAGSEGAPILGFIAFIDQNGNGKFDSGLEQYFRDITSLKFTPSATGELYMAFYDDGVYTDNAGTIDISVKSELESTDIGQDTTICVGDSVELDAQNADAVSWVWNTGATTKTVNVKVAGEYSVEVTSAGGCEIHDTINIATEDIDVSLREDTSFCKGGSVTLTAVSTEAIDWNWNIGETGATITVDSTFEYKIVVANALGCSDSDSVQVTVHELPIVSVGDDQEICNGDSVKVEASTVNVDYLWNTTETAQSIQAKEEGKYDVIITDANGCVAKDTMLLTVNELPKIDLGPDKILCFGSSVGINVGDWSSYLWHDGSDSKSITISGTEKVYIDVTNDKGCKGTDTMQVTMTTIPSVDLGPDIEFCEGDSATIDALNPGLKYEWNNGETTQSIKVKTAGQYHVLVFSEHCSDRDTIEVTVNPNPIVDIGNDTAFCIGGSATFEAGTWSSYKWHTGANGQSITVNETGKVYVEIQDDKTCKGSDTALVVVHVLPVVDLGDDIAVCDGVSVTLDAGLNNVAYLWDSGEQTKTITVDVSGTYGVTVTDANTCEGSDELVLTVNLNPVIDLGPDTVFCVPNSLVLSPGSWKTYLWNDQSAQPTLTVDATGSYHVKITDNNDCEDRDTIEVEVRPLPIVDLGNDTTLCEGATLTLDSQNPRLNILWSTNETTPSITVADGNYSVEVSDNIGCKSSSDIVVLMDIIPDPYPKKEFEICEGEELTLSPEDGYETYTIDWTNASAERSIDVTQEGTYISKVATAHCSESYELNLKVLEVPRVSIEVQPWGRTQFCFEYEQPALRAVTQFIPNLGYRWSTGEEDSVIYATEAGIYDIIVAHDICEDTAQVNLTEFCPANLFVPNAFTTNGDGMNDVFSPVGFNIYGYEMRIYDRWGLHLFTSNDLSVGWDGTYLGNFVQSDVYVYKIYYSFDTESGDSQKETKVGTVTVVR